MLENDIFKICCSEEFEAMALKIFSFQYQHVQIYREFCKHLHISETSVKRLTDIPFLPIQFFKDQVVLTEGAAAEKVFTSSGTTGSVVSKHYVSKLRVYETSFTKTFKLQYGNIEDYTILALLPSYLEREGSSLVYMVDKLIQQSNSPHSGFYLEDTSALVDKILFLEAQQKKVLLLGVSYALLDLIELQRFQLKNTIVMETGGMKGRRKELIKDELHELLKNGFGVKAIHSEYGMTELLSQAYSTGNGLFTCPPWMKVFTRDPEDALTLISKKTGGINVIDLANLYSCSFLATQDLGKIHIDQSFEILGRFDTSDIRGCNLMVL